MAHTIQQVAFRWVKANPDLEKLQTVIATQCDDWLRLNVHVWYLWTMKSPTDIYSGLRTSMTSEDSVVIMPVDPTGVNGWAPQVVWDWLNAKATEKRLGF